MTNDFCRLLPAQKPAVGCSHDADQPLEQRIPQTRHRRESLERARAHEAAGNAAAAYESYQKAVDITPEVAAHFVKVSSSGNLRRLPVKQQAITIGQSCLFLCGPPVSPSSC